LVDWFGGCGSVVYLGAAHGLDFVGGEDIWLG